MSAMHQAGNWDSHVQESSFCMVLPDFHPGFNTFVGSISQNRYFVVDILYFNRYLRLWSVLGSGHVPLCDWNGSSKASFFYVFSRNVSPLHLGNPTFPNLLENYRVLGWLHSYLRRIRWPNMWFPFCTCPMYHRVSFTCFIQPRCQHQNIIKHHQTVKSGSGGLF